VLTTGSHRRTCLFGTVSLNGRQLFRQYHTVNGENFLAYARELKRRFGAFLIVLDKSAPHHRDERVRRWLRKNRNSVKVRWFPTARPERNPVEECWRQTRDIIQANRIYPTFESMKKEISKTLRTKRFRLNIVEYLC
jgi:transposase